MADWIIPIRWLHVLSAAAWFGEVVVINFVLIPALANAQRRDLLAGVFPRVFRLASVLAATTVVTGALLLTLYARGNWGMLTSTRWGISILIGGGMGLLLTVFHFFLEHRLAARIGIGRTDTAEAALEDVHVKLKIVPRIGLAVLTTIFALMMYAVRGI